MTIKDVAREAGVSISSVSRALNGLTANQELLQRVNDAVKLVEYVPSQIGQSFKTQRTGQVAVAVPDISNASYLALVKECQRVFSEAGYRTTLINTGGNSGDDIELIRGLRQKYVDGLIFTTIRPTPELIEEIEASEVPVVLVGSLKTAVSFDVVSTDSKQAARLAVEHLVSQGCRKIGLIGGPLDTVPGRNRYEGFVAAASESGVFFEENIVILKDFEFDSGLEAAKRLIEQGVDGVLGSTDILALSVLHAVRDAGLSVPLNVRVVGVDNSEAARLAIPRLTSIDLGAIDRGRMAAEFLTSRLSGFDSAPKTAIVRPRIVVRESSL
ncbi:MAG: LacI family DNA-binding transcriptional regulator [Aquiluna sp.]|nr:LacI family DNA-binding transcriptional regulator [Aquiluna sp.]